MALGLTAMCFWRKKQPRTPRKKVTAKNCHVDPMLGTNLFWANVIRPSRKARLSITHSNRFAHTHTHFFIPLSLSLYVYIYMYIFFQQAH